MTNSGETSGDTMRLQPHGGRLKTGNPGNHGGRPPSAVRAACLRAFDERIPVLCQLADDERLSAKERLQALEVLAKHAGLAQLDYDPVRVAEAASFLDGR